MDNAHVDLTKDVFTEDEIHVIIGQLEKAEALGYLEERTEANPYLLASYMGVERAGIPQKWNVKIYTYSQKKKGHSVVCVDMDVLRMLLEEDYQELTPPDLQVLRIDDAGWGFPLCGVMVGVSDEQEVRTDTVPVEFFRDSAEQGFQTGRYLHEYTWRAIQLLVGFGAAPSTHRIEICSGYVNQPVREILRQLGFDVRVVEIKGLLQERLEAMYQGYVQEEVEADIYYDPKALDRRDLPRRYREALKYGQENYPHLVKTGWNALRSAQRQ